MDKTYQYPFPVSGTALDFLKIAAALLMVVDHYDHIILERESLLMVTVGRAVFPLFCYGVAAFLLRAGPEKAGHYVVRLLVLAVFTEPISRLFRDMDDINVLFTLAIGAAFAVWLQGQGFLVRNLSFLICLVAMPVIPSGFEFGLVGVALPAAMYFVMRGEKIYIPWLVMLLLMSNAPNILLSMAESPEEASSMFVLTFVMGLSALFLPCFVLLLSKDIKGQRRLLPKYFLHVFYPAHIMVLGLIKYLYFA